MEFEILSIGMLIGLAIGLLLGRKYEPEGKVPRFRNPPPPPNNKRINNSVRPDTSSSLKNWK